MSRGTQQSPWVWEAVDYQGNVIRITVVFNNATRALSSATVSRDAACVYTKIYIGIGADGTPDTTHAIPVPAGTTPITARQMAAVGLHVIGDVIAFQITAGP